MKKMYLANGFSNYPIIKAENLENAIATRGTETGIIFVNVEKLVSLSSKEILGTLIHETTHGLKYGEATEDYTVEEKTARTKEGRAEKEYKDKDVKDIKGLSEEEKKEYLSSKKEYIERISEDTRLEREYAESLQNKSTDEPVENVYDPLYIEGAQLGYQGAELEEYVKARRIKEARERIKDWESFKKSLPNSQKVLVDYIVYCQERKIIPVDGTSVENKEAMRVAGYKSSMTIDEYIKEVNLSKTDQKDLKSWKLVSYSYVAYELYTTVDSYYKAGKIISAKNTKKKTKTSTVFGDKVNSKIPIDDFNKIKAKSVHNLDSDTLTLGKYEPIIKSDGTIDWSKAGPKSYNKVAGNTTYFDMGSDWDKVQKKYKLSNDEMFDLFNKPVSGIWLGAVDLL